VQQHLVWKFPCNFQENFYKTFTFSDMAICNLVFRYMSRLCTELLLICRRLGNRVWFRVCVSVRPSVSFPLNQTELLLLITVVKPQSRDVRFQTNEVRKTLGRYMDYANEMRQWNREIKYRYATYAVKSPRIMNYFHAEISIRIFLCDCTFSRKVYKFNSRNATDG